MFFLYLNLFCLTAALPSEVIDFSSCSQNRSSHNITGVHHFILSSFAGRFLKQDYFFKYLLEDPVCTVYTLNVANEHISHFSRISKSRIVKSTIIFQYLPQFKSYDFSIKIKTGYTQWLNYFFYLNHDRDLIVYKCVLINDTIQEEMAVVFQNFPTTNNTSLTDQLENKHLKEFINLISPTFLTEDSFSKKNQKFEKGRCEEPLDEDTTFIIVLLTVIFTTICLLSLVYSYHFVIQLKTRKNTLNWASKRNDVA